MNGTLVAAAVPGADAATCRLAAVAAEASNLDGIWVGDPQSQAANSDDSYVLATIAGLAAVTRDIRLGAFLSLRSVAPVLRIAEDIGVVDSAAGGRLELGLVAPADDHSGWEERATELLTSFHVWPLGDGRTMSVLPKSRQPWLPRFLVNGSETLAERLGAGIAVRPGAPFSGDLLRRQRVLIVDRVDGGWRRHLSHDAVGVITDLRAQIDAVGAHSIVVLVEDGPTLEDDLHVLGTVVGTGVRCADYEVPVFAADAWRWVTERTVMHRSPSQ